MHLHPLELHLNIKAPPQVFESTPCSEMASSMQVTESRAFTGATKVPGG